MGDHMEFGKPNDPKTLPDMPSMVADVMSALGMSEYRQLPKAGGQAGWKIYRAVRPDGQDAPVPVLLLEHKAKAIPDAKRQISNIPDCIGLFHLKSEYTIYFKSGPSSTIFMLGSEDACRQIRTVLASVGFATVDNKTRARLAIRWIIKDIPTTTSNFNNRGVFSTHYLKTRVPGMVDPQMLMSLKAVLTRGGGGGARRKCLRFWDGQICKRNRGCYGHPTLLAQQLF